MRKGFIYLIVFVCLTFSNGCKKSTTEIPTESLPGWQVDKIMSQVNQWLDKGKSLYNNDDSLIEKLRHNLDTKNATLEDFIDQKQIACIPIFDSYQSKNNSLENSKDYLVVVLYDGKVIKGNVIQFISFNEQLNLPKKTFSKLFTFQNTGLSGKFTFLNIVDNFRYEIKLNKGVLKSYAERVKKYDNPNAKTNGCINWFLDETTFYSDGSSETTSTFLFQTCDGDCQSVKLNNGKAFFIECADGGGQEEQQDIHEASYATDCESFVFTRPSTANWLEAGITDLYLKLAWLTPSGHKIIIETNVNQLVFGIPDTYADGTKVRTGEAANWASAATDNARIETYQYFRNWPTQPQPAQVTEYFRSRANYYMNTRGGNVSINGSGHPSIIFKSEVKSFFTNPRDC